MVVVVVTQWQCRVAQSPIFSAQPVDSSEDGLSRALRATHLHLIGVRNLVVEADATYIESMLSNPDAQLNPAINHWIARHRPFQLRVSPHAHRQPDGLSRCEPVPGEGEHDDPENWVDNELPLSTRVVSWLDAFPTDAHRTHALVLSLGASDDDDEAFAQHNCPHRDRFLPARYRTDDFIFPDTPCTPNRLRPLSASTSGSHANPSTQHRTSRQSQQHHRRQHQFIAPASAASARPALPTPAAVTTATATRPSSWPQTSILPSDSCKSTTPSQTPPHRVPPTTFLPSFTSA